jgi:cell division transport system permease protein
MLELRSDTGSRGLPLQWGGEMRLLLWAFALMTYVAGLGGVGLLAVGRNEAGWRRAAAATATLELPAETSQARLKTLLALLHQTRGVAAARLLTAAETARLLQPWLGPEAQLDGLPLPRLIDLRADPATAIDFPALHKELASVEPHAKLDDNQSWLAGMRRAVRPLRLVLAGCVAAGLIAIAPAAVFAADRAASVDWALIVLAHRLGADDRVITRPFALRSLWLGLAGGAIGGVAAAATLAALGAAAAAILESAPLVGLGSGDWRNWSILAAVALASGLIAATAAQAGLRRRLAALP